MLLRCMVYGWFVTRVLASHDTSLKSHTKTPALQARVTAISLVEKEFQRIFEKKMYDFQETVPELEPASLCFCSLNTLLDQAARCMITLVSIDILC